MAQSDKCSLVSFGLIKGTMPRLKGQPLLLFLGDKHENGFFLIVLCSVMFFSVWYDN